MTKSRSSAARRAPAWLTCLAGVFMTACGGGGGGGSTGTTLSTADSRAYYPMAVGDRWTYRSWSDDDQSASQILLSKATQALTVQGQAAIALHTYLAADGTDDDVEYMAVTDTAVAQLPDPSSSPTDPTALPAIDLLRFPLSTGTSYQQLDQTIDAGGDYDGDGRDESVHIVSRVDVLANGSAQTDAGRFDNCVHVRTVVTQTGLYTAGHAPVVVTTTVDDWYAKDIGLVLEDSVTNSASLPSSAQHLSLVNFAVDGVRSDTVAPHASLIRPTGPQGPFTVIELSYSESMDVSTVTADSVSLVDASGTRVPLVVARGTSSYTFTPANGVLATGVYTVSVGGGATDLTGNVVAPASWSFTVDATAPTVIATSPADQATEVPLNATMTIDFSEDIDPATVADAIQLLGGSNYAPVDTSLQGRRVTVTPRSPLSLRTNYQLFVNESLRDVVGNPMTALYTVNFSTDPGPFGYPQTSSKGSSPMAVAVGDVTGDGRNDVVMTNWFYFDADTDYKLYVYPQLANGTLGAPVAYATQANYVCEPSAVAVADVNGDGRKDVLIAESGCGIEVLTQDANGHLVSSNFLSSPESHMMRVADLDGDGRMDIVGIGWGTGQVAVWKQLADGTMSGPLLYPLQHFGWEDLDIGDINGDGRPDIVVSSGQGDYSHALAVLAQQPDGSFGNPQYVPLSSPPGSVAVGDIDGDGRQDIVVGMWFESSIGLIRQGASGQLGTPTFIAAPGEVNSIEVADMNGDGRQDIVAKSGNGFAVYTQQADGSMGAYQSYAAPLGGDIIQPQSMTVGDVNGDGYPDVVGAGLTYVLNRSGQATVSQAHGAKASGLGATPSVAPAAASTRKGWSALKSLPNVSGAAR